MNVFKSKKGAALEMIIIFIVVCVAFSLTVTTTAMFMTRSTKTAQKWISEKIKLDQAGEYFIRTIHELNELKTPRNFVTPEDFELSEGIDSNEKMVLRQLIACGYTWKTYIDKIETIGTKTTQRYQLQILKKNYVVADIVVRADVETVDGITNVTYTIENWSY